MGKMTQAVLKGMKGNVNTVEDLFYACYYFYPLSARWQWEEVLEDVLAEAVSEGKITNEQSEQLRFAVLDCFFEMLDEEREERWEEILSE